MSPACSTVMSQPIASTVQGLSRFGVSPLPMATLRSASSSATARMRRSPAAMPPRCSYSLPSALLLTQERKVRRMIGWHWPMVLMDLARLSMAGSWAMRAMHSLFFAVSSLRARLWTNSSGTWPWRWSLRIGRRGLWDVMILSRVQGITICSPPRKLTTRCAMCDSPVSWSGNHCPGILLEPPGAARFRIFPKVSRKVSLPLVFVICKPQLARQRTGEGFVVDNAGVQVDGQVQGLEPVVADQAQRQEPARPVVADDVRGVVVGTDPTDNVQVALAVPEGGQGASQHPVHVGLHPGFGGS